MSTASSGTKNLKRPGQSGTSINVRLQPDQLGWLDEWRAGKGMTRPEAIRYLLEWARVQGS